MSDFQRFSGKQGDWFEETCVLALKLAGFEIADQRVAFHEIGIEIDIVGTNKKGISFYFECKGSMRGDRPGLERTDTVKKGLLSGYKLAEIGFSPFVMLTSHKPTEGRAAAMIHSTPRNILFDLLHPIEDHGRLCWLAYADDKLLEQELSKPLMV